MIQFYIQNYYLELSVRFHEDGAGGRLYVYIYWMSFPGGSDVKSLPAMQETQVQSLGQEDLLEKGMATHSSILAWRIPWTEEHHGLQSMRLQRIRHD